LTRCKEEFFTGSENLFASGTDLKEITSFKPLQALELAKLGQDLMRKIRLRNSISAINGLCYGGAFDLVLNCKRRIASNELSP
jgi:enoyl-CoA hydratase/carnithine racemase